MQAVSRPADSRADSTLSVASESSSTGSSFRSARSDVDSTLHPLRKRICSPARQRAQASPRAPPPLSPSASSICESPRIPGFADHCMERRTHLLSVQRHQHVGAQHEQPLSGPGLLARLRRGQDVLAVHAQGRRAAYAAPPVDRHDGSHDGQLGHLERQAQRHLAHDGAWPSLVARRSGVQRWKATSGRARLSVRLHCFRHHVPDARSAFGGVYQAQLAR